MISSLASVRNVLKSTKGAIQITRNAQLIENVPINVLQLKQFLLNAHLWDQLVIFIHILYSGPTGKCLPCSEHLKIPCEDTSKKCFANACVECTQDSDCKEGNYCHYLTHRCVECDIENSLSINFAIMSCPMENTTCITEKFIKKK